MTTQPTRSVPVHDADPFAVLGLHADADLTDDQVEQAWQQRLHERSDRGGEETVAITAAYQALRSGVRRADLLVDREKTTTDHAWPIRATDETLVRLVAIRLGNLPASDQPHRNDPGTLERAGTDRFVTDEDRAMAAEREAGPSSRPSSRPSDARLEEVRRRVIEERKEQGLPEFIEDPAILDKIVDILTLSLDHGEHHGERAPTPTSAEPGSIPWQRVGTEERQGAPHDERLPRRLAILWWRIRQGRPMWLAVRILVAVAVPVTAFLRQPDYPSWIALAVGSVTWLVATARYDLAGRSLR